MNDEELREKSSLTDETDDENQWNDDDLSSDLPSEMSSSETEASLPDKLPALTSEEIQSFEDQLNNLDAGLKYQNNSSTILLQQKCSLLSDYQRRAGVNFPLMDELYSVRCQLSQISLCPASFYQDWINDERKLDSWQQTDRTFTLFERALSDHPSSVSLWSDYIAYATSQFLKSSISNESFQNLLLRASASAASYHFQQGHQLFDSLRASAACLKWMEQIQYWFKLQLEERYLSGNEETQKEYEQFKEEAQQAGMDLNFPEIGSIHKNQEKWQTCQKYEKQLNRLKNEFLLLETFSNYSKFLSNPEKISLWERALQMQPLNEKYWLSYIYGMYEMAANDDTRSNALPLASVCYRATRACPQSVALWQHYLRSSSSNENVSSVFDYALSQLSLAKEIIPLFITYCRLMQLALNEGRITLETFSSRANELLSQVEQVEDNSLVPSSNEAVIQFYDLLLTLLPAEKSRALWEKLLKKYRHFSFIWRRAIQWEWQQSVGEESSLRMHRCRALYKRAYSLYHLLDDPSLVRHEWLHFEQVYGDEASLRLAELKLFKLDAELEKKGLKQKKELKQQEAFKELKKKERMEKRNAANQKSSHSEPPLKRVKVDDDNNNHSSSQTPFYVVLHEKARRTLFLSNVPFSATEKDIQTLFPLAHQIRLVKSKGQFIGKAFVEMPNENQVLEILNGRDFVFLSLNGKHVKVSLSREATAQKKRKLVEPSNLQKVENENVVIQEKDISQQPLKKNLQIIPRQTVRKIKLNLK